MPAAIAELGRVRYCRSPHRCLAQVLGLLDFNMGVFEKPRFYTADDLIDLHASAAAGRVNAFETT